jgi:pimeloyl-ACP methyl ester carboxylesterase
VTPRSWEHWIDRYQQAGYNVIAPAYPGFEVEVEARNADPTPIEALTAPAIISHLESVVGALDEPPIIIGHSAGGAFTQVCWTTDSAWRGVAINSAPTEGVRVIRCRSCKATFPVLKNPANRHKAVGLTPEQWKYTFANTFTEEESLELYKRYHVPASGRIFWNSVLANFEPGPQNVHVDYHNDNRRAAAVHLRQRGPPHAAERAAVQRQALQVAEDHHRDQGVRRHAAPAARAQGLERGRRLRPDLGREASRLAGPRPAPERRPRHAAMAEPSG